MNIDIRIIPSKHSIEQITLYDVEHTTTLKYVLNEINGFLNVDTANSSLIFGGILLDDLSKTLGDYQINEETLRWKEFSFIYKN